MSQSRLATTQWHTLAATYLSIAILCHKNLAENYPLTNTSTTSTETSKTTNQTISRSFRVRNTAKCTSHGNGSTQKNQLKSGVLLLNAIVSGFCHCKICCGPHATGLTAAGTRPVEGRTVALPRRFPLGSRVIIDGHTYVGEDRTARRFDGRIDVYCASHEKAKRRGISTNLVTIITK